MPKFEYTVDVERERTNMWWKGLSESRYSSVKSEVIQISSGRAKLYDEIMCCQCLGLACYSDIKVSVK